MKYFLSLYLFVLGAVISVAQEKTIILTESSLPYTEQQWFSGGRFPADQINYGWNEGKRIHAAAYTTKGWFLSMAKGTGYTMQTYNNQSTWPEEWIKNNWDADYRITDLAYGNGKWLVIMSQNSGLATQKYKSSSSWEDLATWFEEQRKEGYMITNLAYTGTEWTVVISQDSQYNSQDYLLANNSEELVSKIKGDVWGKDHSVHMIEYGGDKYIVVYGDYVSNTDRTQNFWTEGSDPKGYIYKRWSESKKIAYLGGGSSTGYRSGNDSDGERSGSLGISSRMPCPKCNGRGYELQTLTNAPASIPGWMPPYHHTWGYACPYCNHYDDHYHSPCSECYGYGRVK